MLKSQAETLNLTGLALLDKAPQLQDTEEANATVELGMKCLAEAREILSQMRSNSVLIYLECCAHLSTSGGYGFYLDFCARNGLEIMSEIDYDSAIL